MAVDRQYGLIERLDRHLDETLTRFDEARTPIWESQADVGRTLVTLASGSLVISITWVQFLVTKVPHPEWRLLLITSWSLFALTVILAAARQGWSGRARSYRLGFERRRGDLRAVIARIDAAGGGSDEIDAAIATVVEEANRYPASAVRVYNGISHVMFWSFAIGLISLLGFALRNLPF